MLLRDMSPYYVRKLYAIFLGSWSFDCHFVKEFQDLCLIYLSLGFMICSIPNFILTSPIITSYPSQISSNCFSSSFLLSPRSKALFLLRRIIHRHSSKHIAWYLSLCGSFDPQLCLACEFLVNKFKK